MITIYGMKASGNCYKLQLLLSHLRREHRWVEIDSTRGETRTPEYLAKNPNGKVPLLELEDGRLLAESNAILCYLAEGSNYLPSDSWQRAQALQWLFFEQYSHEPYIAVARFVAKWLPADHPRRAELPKLRERGYQALDVMEKHLSANAFFECGLRCRRHRLVRLYPRSAGRRFRPVQLSGGASLVAARRSAARFRRANLLTTRKNTSCPP